MREKETDILFNLLFFGYTYENHWKLMREISRWKNDKDTSFYH